VSRSERASESRIDIGGHAFPSAWFPSSISSTFWNRMANHLFGFYEQIFDWPRGLNRLRRSNLVFASGSALALNAWSSGYEDQIDQIDGEASEAAACVTGRRKS
jgi:hypothetical protein